jgi:hypothetical protein
MPQNADSLAGPAAVPEQATSGDVIGDQGPNPGQDIVQGHEADDENDSAFDAGS